MTQRAARPQLQLEVIELEKPVDLDAFVDEYVDAILELEGFPRAGGSPLDEGRRMGTVGPLPRAGSR